MTKGGKNRRTQSFPLSLEAVRKQSQRSRRRFLAFDRNPVQARTDADLGARNTAANLFGVMPPVSLAAPLPRQLPGRQPPHSRSEEPSMIFSNFRPTPQSAGRIILCCVSLLIVAALTHTARSDGVHLVILSRQSNMNGVRPEEAFVPAVEKRWTRSPSFGCRVNVMRARAMAMSTRPASIACSINFVAIKGKTSTM